MSTIAFILLTTRKFYISWNDSKVDFIETEPKIIADSFSWSDLEKCMYITLF